MTTLYITFLVNVYITAITFVATIIIRVTIFIRLNLSLVWQAIKTRIVGYYITVVITNFDSIVIVEQINSTKTNWKYFEESNW